MQYASTDIYRRFGYGPKYGQNQKAVLPAELTHHLLAEGIWAQRYGLGGLDASYDALKTYYKLRQQAGQSGQSQSQTFSRFRRQQSKLSQQRAANFFKRAIAPELGISARLNAFWLNHFAVSSGALFIRFMFWNYVDIFTRATLSGPFSEMLFAATTHPAMIRYLNQQTSFGPRSKRGVKTSKGLNENLAREVLELHTLGVDGNYSQKDVRQLAELFTGLTATRARLGFNPRIAEPGKETIFGKEYGGDPAQLSHIAEFLHDLSLRPDTARFLSQKLARHFISQDPPQALVDKMADNYLAKEGQLSALYEVLFNDPLAVQNHQPSNVKPPLDFVISSLRALNITPQDLDALSGKELNANILAPLTLMGQPFYRPDGPDGWPEAPEYWITPVGIAGRIQWARQIAELYGKDIDPRRFGQEILAERYTHQLSDAVVKAPDRAEGIALVLTSPAFNRR